MFSVNSPVDQSIASLSISICTLSAQQHLSPSKRDRFPVGGDRHWVWTFVTDDEVLYKFDESRGSQVLEAVLGEESRTDRGGIRLFSPWQMRWSHRSISQCARGWELPVLFTLNP